MAKAIKQIFENYIAEKQHREYHSEIETKNILFGGKITSYAKHTKQKNYLDCLHRTELCFLQSKVV